MAISDEITARNHAIRMAEKSKKVGLRAGKKEGIAIGEKRGEKRGEQKERIRIVRSLSLKGFPLDEIAEVTHMSVEEVNDILNHSNNE
jgi:predicted transposase YdaD